MLKLFQKYFAPAEAYRHLNTVRYAGFEPGLTALTCRVADIEYGCPPGLTAELTEGSILQGELVVGHVQRLNLLGGRVPGDTLLLKKEQPKPVLWIHIHLIWIRILNFGPIWIRIRGYGMFLKKKM